MKTYILCFGLLFSSILMAQQKTGEHITVSDKQNDDTYIAGETIITKAPIIGDMVIAGGTITVKDTVYQDLLVAGGEIMVNGYIADDIRAAGGKLTIDSEVGDDVIVAGGEVYITENAIIHGNLVNFSGNIKMNGIVKGTLKSYSGDLEFNGKVGQKAHLFGENVRVNGEILGTSKIAAEEIEIGDNAKFHGDVEYWSEDGELDFKNTLVNVKATYNEELIADRDEFSWRGLGLAGIGFFMIYVLSAFLILLLLNWAFSNLFSEAAKRIDKSFWQSFGYGLLYLFGVPLLIIITFMLIIGIPISLFLFSIYVFSVLFGHLVAALLITHYLNKNRTQKFWPIVFISLGIAIVLRLLTLVPFLGGLVSMVIIALAYGLLLMVFWEQRKNKLKIAE